MWGGMGQQLQARVQQAAWVYAHGGQHLQVVEGQEHTRLWGGGLGVAGQNLQVPWEHMHTSMRGTCGPPAPHLGGLQGLGLGIWGVRVYI